MSSLTMSSDGAGSFNNDESTSAPFAPGDVPEKKRRRPPLACEQCRRRKIKCDRNSPCGHCTRARLPNCSYAPAHVPASRAKRSTPSELPTRSSSGVAQRPVRPAPAPSADPRVVAADGYAVASDSRPVSKASSSVASSNVGSASESSNVDWLVARVHDLEEKLANALHITEPKTNSRLIAAGEDSVAPLSGTVSKARYFGNSHWLNITDLVRMLASCIASTSAELVALTMK